MNATLILGASPRMSVPIARSLSRHGIPIVCAGFGPLQRKITSRAIGRFVWFPDLEPSNPTLLAQLMELIKHERVDYLVPCTDGALGYIAHHYTALSRLAKPACPRPEVIARGLDKELTLQMAQACGVPVPRRVEAEKLLDLELLGPERFPLVVKPRTKWRSSQFKVRYVTDRNALLELARQNRDFSRDFLVQEYCPGDGVGLEILMCRDEPVIVFQHRRIVEHPRSGGASVIAVSEAPDPMLADMAVRLLSKLEWDGVAMVEFRHDRATGRAVLMEINGRYWGSLGLSRRCGVDFPYAQWLCDHDGSPVPATATIGVRARWTAGVVSNVAAACRPFSFRGLLTELRHSIPDLSPAIRDMVFDLRDPMPAIQEVTTVVWQETKALVKEALSSILPGPLLADLAATRRYGFRSAQMLRRRRVRRRTGHITLPTVIRSALFICHGNIIRSPIAAHLFRRGLSSPGGITVTSAGLSAKVGNKADPRAIETATRLFDIDLSPHRARPVTEDLVDEADIVLVMDRENEVGLLTRFPHASSKTFLLAELGELGPSSNCEIHDPYEGTTEDVMACFNQLSVCIAAALERLGMTSALPSAGRRH